MYYQHFGLTEPPFKITPNTEFFFTGGNRGAILEALRYAISHGEGMVKVSGEVGSGKTMLCRMLQAHLPENVISVYLANPNLAPEDILHAIAFELQLPVSAQSSRFEVMQALQNFLVARHGEGKRVVVFVEEAQGMPLPTLEEVRLLSNLETERDKLLQIVLFGQPELNANIGRPEMRQLRERITHSFDLPPLSREDIREYLAHRLQTAGYHGPDLFSQDVVRYFADISKGLTRRVNILADKTMLAAFADNTHNITLKHAQTAANDSEFAPPAKPAGNSWKAAVAAAVLLALGIGIGLLVSRPQQLPTQTAHATTPAQPAAIPAQPATQNAPAAAPAKPSASLLENRLAATESWLASQPPETFTIQLMGGDNQRMLGQFLNDLGRSLDSEKLYVFRTVAGGKPSMTVTYGSFSGRGDAAQTLQSLPDSLKRHQPILRSVKGIRAERQQIQQPDTANP